MRAVTRERGFTLIEIIIALMLGALVATVVVQTMVGTQRATQAGMRQIDVRQNLRAGAAYLGSVIRELDAQDGDIVVATPTRFQFRGMRWVGVLCGPPVAGAGTTVILPMSRDQLYGLRVPNAVEDSILVFRDGNRSSRADDAWLVGAVSVIGASNCSDGSPATALTVDITAASGGQAAVLSGVSPGAPLRGFQAEEISLFQGAGGRWWMGQRTANGAGSWSVVRPLIGPLTTATGMELAYYDSTGAVTGTLTDIASVAVSLRAESRDRIRRGVTTEYARDSLLTRVALRNNPRF